LAWKKGSLDNNRYKVIIIVDYGLGNIGSIENMISHIGLPAQISNDPLKISEAKALILPGVGKFDQGITNLEENISFKKALITSVLEKKAPILGICLGMQLMCKTSEEGNKLGLGWIDATVKKFPPEVGKIPHMGWREVSAIDNNNKIKSNELSSDGKFYFVHSYFVECHNTQDVWMKANYGINFVAAFQKENITGVQFHPEKSHRYGINFFKNYFNQIL